MNSKLILLLALFGLAFGGIVKRDSEPSLAEVGTTRRPINAEELEAEPVDVLLLNSDTNQTASMSETLSDQPRGTESENQSENELIETTRESINKTVVDTTQTQTQTQTHTVTTTSQSMDLIAVETKVNETNVTTTVVQSSTVSVVPIQLPTEEQTSNSTKTQL